MNEAIFNLGEGGYIFAPLDGGGWRMFDPGFPVGQQNIVFGSSFPVLFSVTNTAGQVRSFTFTEESLQFSNGNIFVQPGNPPTGSLLWSLVGNCEILMNAPFKFSSSDLQVGPAFPTTGQYTVPSVNPPVNPPDDGGNSGTSHVTPLQWLGTQTASDVTAAMVGFSLAIAFIAIVFCVTLVRAFSSVESFRD